MTSKGIWKLSGVGRDADRVELKLLVPPSALRKLGVDLRGARTRRVSYLDTDDLALTRHGVIVRVRTSDGGRGDCSVKLRPLEPARLPRTLRRAADFVIDVDALPGSVVWAGTMKKRVRAGKSFPELLCSRQRRLLSTFGPAGVGLDDLREYGPAVVRRRRFQLPGLKPPLTVEEWTYPDGEPLIELSTRCPAAKADQVAARTAAILRRHGIGPTTPQHSKAGRLLVTV